MVVYKYSGNFCYELYIKCDLGHYKRLEILFIALSIYTNRQISNLNYTFPGFIVSRHPKLIKIHNETSHI